MIKTAYTDSECSMATVADISEERYDTFVRSIYWNSLFMIQNIFIISINLLNEYGQDCEIH